MLGKLFCVVALASTALAQGVSIAYPAAGTTIHAGSTFVVQIERPTPSTDVEELGLAIGGMQCFAGMSCSSFGLGHDVLYTGSFNPQGTNKNGNAYQNFTVTAPNFFQGQMGINVARFYLGGLYHVATMEQETITVTLTGASG